MTSQNLNTQNFASELDELIRCAGRYSARLPALKLTGAESDDAYVRPTWLAKEEKQTAAEVVLALFERERHVPVLSTQAARRRMCNRLTTPSGPEDVTAADLGAALGVAVDWRAGADYCAAGIESDETRRAALADALLTNVRKALDRSKLPYESDATYVFQFSHRLAEGLIREAAWIGGPESGSQFKDSTAGQRARDARGASVGGYASISPITAICGNWFSQGTGGGKIESAWGCPVDCGPDGAPRTTYAAKGSSGVVEFPAGTTYCYEDSLTSPSALSLDGAGGATVSDGDDDAESDDDDKPAGKRKVVKKASEAGMSSIPPQKGMIVVRGDAAVARPMISMATITEQRIHNQNGDVDWDATYAWRKFALAYAIYALSRTLSIGLMGIRANCSLRVVDRSAATVQFFDNVGGSVGGLRINLFDDMLAIKQTVETCAQELVTALGAVDLLTARLRPQPWALYLLLEGLKSDDGAPVDLIKQVEEFAKAELKSKRQPAGKHRVAPKAKTAKTKKNAGHTPTVMSESVPT